MTNPFAVVPEQPIIDCLNFHVGTSAAITDDVVKEGVLRADYQLPSVTYNQSENHTFFISGQIGLEHSPVVHSLKENGPQLMAFTKTEAASERIQVEVHYQDVCEGDFELM